MNIPTQPLARSLDEFVGAGAALDIGLTAGLTEIDLGSRSHLGIGKSGTGQGNSDPQGPAAAGTADG